MKELYLTAQLHLLIYYLMWEQSYSLKPPYSSFKIISISLQPLFKAQLKPEEMKTSLPWVTRNMVCGCGRRTQVWYGKLVIETRAWTVNVPWRLGNVRPGAAGLSWIEFSVRGCIHGSCQSPVDEIKSWWMAVKHSWNITTICLIYVFSTQHQFPLISEAFLFHT